MFLPEKNANTPVRSTFFYAANRAMVVLVAQCLALGLALNFAPKTEYGSVWGPAAMAGMTFMLIWWFAYKAMDKQNKVP